MAAKLLGAVELPFTAQQLASTKQYKAIVLLGCVIQGETNHYDYVCMQVSKGTQQVMLQYNLPVIFGVLTTYNKEQAIARLTICFFRPVLKVFGGSQSPNLEFLQYTVFEVLLEGRMLRTVYNGLLCLFYLGRARLKCDVV